MPFASFRSAARAAACGVVLILLGCQSAVREDRTITFGPDGHASFQHGLNGVFVADPKGGVPKRIYEPAPGDIAFSPPAWDPAGKRMVFTVARALDGNQPAPAGDAPADGRRVVSGPIRYTCWLYDPAAGAPEKLFETEAGHAGYVAAGLAVAWHPDGQRLDFVEFAPPPARKGFEIKLTSDPRTHQVRSFNLTTRQADAPFMFGANIVVGCSHGRPHRFALVGGGGESGLWVDSGGMWWRVEDSKPDDSDLETLRRRVPRWSRDGTKLAFAAGESIRVCAVATHRTETWFRSERPPNVGLLRAPELHATLHWHPDGTRVGLIDGTRLVAVGPSEKLESLTGPINATGALFHLAVLVDALFDQRAGGDNAAVSFAGWDASGRRLAYVVTEPLPYAAGAEWATLFAPNPRARTAVRIADTDGANPKTLVGGLHATFPHWARTDSKLSVWLTVEPPYRLADGRVGMPPGDPAALIDPETGKLEWLPVNGTEHAQIGHVELRAGRLAEALRRFDTAAAALPEGAKADWMLFRAVALQKAGRADEARAAWARFEPPPEPDREGERATVNLMRAADPRWPLVEGDLVRSRHRFVAEAFVSVEMADEGIEFLRREVREAKTEPERLSAAVVLCQLLLLTDRKEEYAACVAEHLLPLAARVLAAPIGSAGAVVSVAWTILPLAVGEFTEAIPEESVRRVSAAVTAWTGGGPEADLARQLVLRTCARRLKDDEAARRAAERLASNPSQVWWKPADGKEVDRELLRSIRFAFPIQQRLVEDFLAGNWARPAR